MPDLQSPAVEVRCHRCDVSFPVGTKRCIHCGERIGRPLFGGPAPGHAPEGEEAEDVAVLRGSGDVEAEEADAEPQGRLLRAGFTLFWVVVAVLSAVMRSCQEGP